MKTNWSAVLPAPVVLAVDQNGACAAAILCCARIPVWQMKIITDAVDAIEGNHPVSDVGMAVRAEAKQKARDCVGAACVSDTKSLD